MAPLPAFVNIFPMIPPTIKKVTGANKGARNSTSYFLFHVLLF